MAITLKLYNGKWQVGISNELWEFKYLKEMQMNLDMLLEMKDRHGRIKQYE